MALSHFCYAMLFAQSDGTPGSKPAYDSGPLIVRGVESVGVDRSRARLEPKHAADSAPCSIARPTTLVDQNSAVHHLAQVLFRYSDSSHSDRRD